MTYEESAALMTDPQFRGRIKVASLKYADSIVIAPVPVSSHTSLVRWAAQCIQNPDMVAQTLQPLVVMDAAVQADGAEIADAALQGAVETTVQKIA